MKEENNTKNFADSTQAEIDELIRSKYPIIKNYFTKQDIMPADREDLMQDTVSLVYKYIRTVKDADKADAWIREVAKNSYLKFLKNEYKRKTAFDGSRTIEELIISEDEYGAVCDLIEKMESNERLTGLVKMLGEPNMTVFMLHYIDQYKLVEIAKLTDMNLNTVKSIHARGLKKLRALLELEKGK
ncbi:MAG: sigma-70 family RNA polymerase sigma factor [Clostridiales bacterium]|nr:sigma-70 family RNA polymerase sigma factor [Clostridiales bacterium]